MIILLMNDDAVIEGGQILAKKYPKDRVVVLNEEKPQAALLLDAKGNVVREKDGSLPTRITMLGHTIGRETLSGKTAHEFASWFVKQLETACAIEPKLRQTITKLDVLSCAAGLVDEDGKCFIQATVDALSEAGFNIKVQTFTNLALPEPHPAPYGTSYFSGGKYYKYIFRDAKQFLAFQSTLEMPTEPENIGVRVAAVDSPRDYLDGTPQCVIPSTSDKLKKQIQDLSATEENIKQLCEEFAKIIAHEKAGERKEAKAALSQIALNIIDLAGQNLFLENPDSLRDQFDLMVRIIGEKGVNVKGEMNVVVLQERLEEYRTGLQKKREALEKKVELMEAARAQKLQTFEQETKKGAEPVAKKPVAVVDTPFGVFKSAGVTNMTTLVTPQRLVR